MGANARMLHDAIPPNHRKCRFAARGCRCYLWSEAHSAGAAATRRRTHRHAENREWRAQASKEIRRG